MTALRPIPSTVASHFHPGVAFNVLPDGTTVWQSRKFDGKTKIQFLPVVRAFLESRKWIAKIDESLAWDPSQKAYDRLASLWGQSLLHWGRLRLQVHGLNQLEDGKVYIFAPTHNSHIDVPLLCVALEKWRLGFLADKRFEKSFLGGPMVKSGRSVFVDRNDGRSGVKAIQQMAAILTKPGNRFSMTVFPQGTRAEGRRDPDGRRMDGDLFADGSGSLLAGAAELFLRTAGHGVELVSIVINGTGRVLPKKSILAQTGEDLEMVIGRPWTLEDFGGPPRNKSDKLSVMKAIMLGVETFYRGHYESPL